MGTGPPAPSLQARAGGDTSCTLPAGPPPQALTCVGRDDFGQASPTGTATFVELGRNVGCKMDGMPPQPAICWGDDANGQVSSAPATTMKYVSPGLDHVCGVTSTDTLECWGSATGDIVGFEPTGPSFKFVEVESDMACAVDTTNTLSCWGTGVTGNEPTSIQQVDLSDDYGCGIDTALGAIVCWNDGTIDDRVTAAPTTGGWYRVGTGIAGACALGCSGQVVCWGDTTTPPALVTDAPTGTWRVLSVGDYHACAVDYMDQTFCWGDDSFNQLIP